MAKFNILKDRYLLAYITLYLAALVSLGLFESYDLTEAVSVGVIFGLILPGIAYLSCRSCKPLGTVREATSSQLIYVGICIAAVAIWMSLGSQLIYEQLGINTDSLRLREVAKLGLKLLFFVAIPVLVFSGKFGFSLKDYGLEFDIRKWLKNKQVWSLPVLIGFMTLLQLIIGQAAEPIRSGAYSASQLILGLPLAFLWLFIEVGLVEEFFFRAVVQARVAAYLKSETAGILIGGVVFGLAHAPGLYLRGAGANSPVGADPSMLLTLGYSIVVLSAAGLFMGLVWSRTRNLLLVMLIHASVDLLPGFDEFATIWKLFGK